MGILTIHLDKCTNLARTDVFTKSDPYVWLELEQDNWVKDVNYGKQKSNVAEGRDPVFNQTFTYNIPTLDNMVLTCKIRDEDIGSRDDKMGWCKIKLEDAGLTSRPKKFEEVVDRNVLRKNGEIHLQLSYSE